uniref:Uncharacterized protein n=1 Tax=Anguilla anguilla TaxID=7936 RepID=A0A0E9W910_ANGAN
MQHQGTLQRNLEQSNSAPLLSRNEARTIKERTPSFLI